MSDFPIPPKALNELNMQLLLVNEAPRLRRTSDGWVKWYGEPCESEACVIADAEALVSAGICSWK